MHNNSTGDGEGVAIDLVRGGGGSRNAVASAVVDASTGMPAYILTSAQAAERWGRMEARLRALRANYTKFGGIDGRQRIPNPVSVRATPSVRHEAACCCATRPARPEQSCAVPFTPVPAVVHLPFICDMADSGKVWSEQHGG